VVLRIVEEVGRIEDQLHVVRTQRLHQVDTADCKVAVDAFFILMLIERNGDDFEIYLRLLKKKIVTVVLDTYHDVHYFSPDSRRWCIRSYTKRISEVADAGKPDEKTLPPDTGHGYLWRLYSYWRFEEKVGGVRIECRAISLSRDVPSALRLIIEPIIRKLPKASLIATLESTRQALSDKAEPAAGPPEQKG
jgi:hypothetical protein